METASGTVLHFSEDPRITEFVPHLAQTARDPTPYVWAVEEQREPDYWFPRQCPRAMAWVLPTSSDVDRDPLLGPGGPRVHLIEYRWLARLQKVRLYAYRFAAAPFVPHGDNAVVCRSAVRPLGPPEEVGDLLARHEAAGIELRLAPSLGPWWQAVTASTLGFSGIRLGNADPAVG